MLSRRYRSRTLGVLAVVGVVGCGSSESSPTTRSPSAGNGGSPASSGGSSGAGRGGTSGGAGTSGGLGGAATTVSYARDVQPLFQPCAYCHYTGSILVDIERPFAPSTGVVNTDNAWAVDHPEGNTPPKDVMPGDPDHSFLIWKIGGHGTLDEATSGSPMPWAIPRLTADELAALRAWISAGAPNDQTFTDQILPIFGVPGTLGSAAGKCTFCHFPGGQLPDLSKPFDPVVGVVGLPSVRGQGMKLIEPGNPDASFLVVKVTSPTLPGPQGLPMPAHFPALAATDIDTVRSWIREGALNN